MMDIDQTPEKQTDQCEKNCSQAGAQIRTTAMLIYFIFVRIFPPRCRPLSS